MAHISRFEKPRLFGVLLAAVSLAVATAPPARAPPGLHQALAKLTSQGQYSGAVVVRDERGVRFASGYGMADPFTGRAFTPDTPVDSGSIAKPVTAAAVLMLARDGRVDLDAPVRTYLPGYPHAQATVRHLLAHSAGLALKESPETLSGKSNAALLAEVAQRGEAPIFTPGSGYTYCNLCTIALALLVERVTGDHWLEAARARAGLPPHVSVRPVRLADWKGRAIGYRRTAGGTLERFDSWEGEAFYGPGNLSITARQIARWGSEWWGPRLASIRPLATDPAEIGGKQSGLSWGNWYCAPDRRRCHYLGHHEGFHHMLYWDSGRRITVAMVSNNGLSPALQQRLQRALVAFASGAPQLARRELRQALPDTAVEPGTYLLPGGERISVDRTSDRLMSVNRRGIAYPAYPAGSGIRYVPGLDAYIAGAPGGRLHWLTLYEDRIALPE